MYIQLGFLTTAFTALTLFALLAPTLSDSARARVDRQGRSPFLGRLLVEFAYWLLSPIVRLAIALEVSPNASSWACLLLGVASGVVAAAGAIPLAGALVLGSALFDVVDGMLARSLGLASDAGEVLDAAADRYSEFCFLTGLCFYYRREPWAMLAVQSALLASMMVSYSQAKSEAMRIEPPRCWMRRPERVVYLGGGAFLSPLITTWLESGNPQPVHYPLLLAVLLVAIFGNVGAIRRFGLLYRIARSRSPFSRDLARRDSSRHLLG